MDNQWEIMNKICEYRKDENNKTNLESSKNRLFRIFKKKTTTSFIGALDKFEKAFGGLWGHGKKSDEYTPNQIAWRKIWEQVRTEILNNGNSQVRALENEINEYDIKWNRKSITLNIKEKE